MRRKKICYIHSFFVLFPRFFVQFRYNNISVWFSFDSTTILHEYNAFDSFARATFWKWKGGQNVCNIDAHPHNNTVCQKKNNVEAILNDWECVNVSNIIKNNIDDWHKLSDFSVEMNQVTIYLAPTACTSFTVVPRKYQLQMLLCFGMPIFARWMMDFAGGVCVCHRA